MNYLILTTLFLTSCIGVKGQNKYEEKIMAIADSLSLRYIDSLNVSNFDTTYVTILYDNSFENEGLTAFSIYSYERPRSGNDMPFKYSQLSNNKNKYFYAFHYDDEKQFDRDSIIKKLNNKGLLIIDKNGIRAQGDWKFMFTEESWEVFICKENYNKIKIIKSFSVIEEADVPKKLCSDN